MHAPFASEVEHKVTISLFILCIGVAARIRWRRAPISTRSMYACCSCTLAASQLRRERARACFVLFYSFVFGQAGNRSQVGTLTERRPPREVLSRSRHLFYCSGVLRCLAYAATRKRPSHRLHRGTEQARLRAAEPVSCIFPAHQLKRERSLAARFHRADTSYHEMTKT